MASSNDELDQLQRKLRGDDVRDAVRALLEPGEELREFGQVHEAYGDAGPVSQSRPVELKSPKWFDRVWAAGTRTTPRKVAFFTLLAPLMLLAFLVGGGSSALADRLFGGRVCQGPRDSTARHVQHALNVLGPGADRMAVSDRRILLLHQRLFADPPQLTPILSVPFQDLAAAHHRPRGLLRRRVELRFTDGSWIVLALPSFEAPSPRRVLAALPVG